MNKFFKKLQKKGGIGFTMIELLIVISVLGVLAVAVLSAINPIEQINRGKDTGSRSDAEQLISAVDRYYTTKGYYPWRSSATAGADAQAWLRLIAYSTWKDDTNIDVLSKLDGTAAGAAGTAEIKASFTARISGTGYNFLYVYNGGVQGNSTYVCFNGKSKSFQSEASERCSGTKGSIPGDLVTANVCNVTVDGVAAQYMTCLP